MLDFFYPKHPFESQTLRLVAEAQQGGGDIFDIARLCRKIEPGDKQGWERAWLDLAHATEIEAKEALAAGTLQEVFSDEIDKSLKEYQEQVDPEVIAQGTFFNDALNSILAE